MRAPPPVRTLPAPILSATSLAETASDLVRAALKDHPDERFVTLLAISVSHIGPDDAPQLELPFALQDDGRRPESRKGMARLRADAALDAIRSRFGRAAAGYAQGLMGAQSVPDDFRSLAEKEL